MTRRSLRILSVVAIMAGAVVLGGSNRAEAALRLTLTSGAQTKQFYSTTNRLTVDTTIGGYTVALETVRSNYPGQDHVGSLSTTSNLETGAGPVEDLVIFAEVVESADASSSLATFSAPISSQLTLRSNVGGTVDFATSGTVDFRSTANETNADVNGVTIVPLAEASSSTSFNGSSGYTLTNRTVIRGLSNLSGVNIIGSTAVLAPEPATMAMALAGLPLMGFGAWLRRRRSQV